MIARLLKTLFFCFSTILSFPIDPTGLSRRFDGIGGLSAGATSRLLVNYPQPQRDQVLDYLFKPNFGASLHILKVEIGGDAQSTDGTEASHMHNSWDENYRRGYEWWLMVEAKKRNPDILLYGLPWAFPGWVGNGTRNPYTNLELTANYIIKWILGAKTYYNLTIDFVGIWNERPSDNTYIKILRKSLDSAGLSHTRIVAADGSWGIADDILKDTELAAAVDFLGAHYPGTNSDASAKQTGKQLWSSEDYSTKNDNVGGGCWARILNQNYVNGLMTSTISWNLIASYYEALPFARDGLMTADNPWSGNYVVESPIWLSAHTTQFTSPGWHYLPHGQGVGKLNEGGSYVSLVSPDRKDLTVVIETMSHDHSECIRPALPPYTVKPQNVTFQLKGGFASLKQLNVWYSKLGFKNETTTLFQKQKPIQVTNGAITVSLGVDEMYTLTTLSVGQKGVYPSPPLPKPFPLPYTEDFEKFQEFSEPDNFAQQVGSFEVRRSSDSRHRNVLQQVVLHTPLGWCPINQITPLNVIGNNSWSNIHIEADIAVGPVNGTTGVFVAARVDKGGCDSWQARGIYFFVFPQKKTYILAGDLARTLVLNNGSAPSAVEGWNHLSLSVNGTSATASLNNQLLFTVSVPYFPAHGFVGIGTDTFGIADFDNIQINSVHVNKKKKDEQIHKKDSKYKNHKKSDTLYFIPRY